jgi:serine/threonine protein kinase
MLQQTEQRLHREIVIWRDLNHPNVSEFLGIAYLNSNLPPGLVSRYVLRHDFLAYIGRHPNLKREKVLTICSTLLLVHGICSLLNIVSP